jgi:hypothetical protein
MEDFFKFELIESASGSILASEFVEAASLFDHLVDDDSVEHERLVELFNIIEDAMVQYYLVYYKPYNYPFEGMTMSGKECVAFYINEVL